MVTGRVLVAGAGEGPLLRLSAPISFWGGVDPLSGRIADPRHPDHGRSVAGMVLAVPSAVGSSSSSAIMLELLRNGVAPAAVLMGTADAILALGVALVPVWWRLAFRPSCGAGSHAASDRTRRRRGRPGRREFEPPP